ncbi:MAG TPA: rhomboid family intramembrane serine protease [Solirubrobacteraceae bacterium]|nr:rhomboid family intramembrane serine protease [Solirubrobacteraceae bacterium]
MSTAAEAPRSTRNDGLVLLAGMAAVMWAVEIVDVIAFDLDSHGIEPRQTDGLPGILFAPFLHGGFGHLIGNTIPFLVLGFAIAVSGLVRVAAVTAVVVVVGGLGTWLVGPDNTVHIGASGVVFGYATYLTSRAFWTRRLIDVGVAVLVLGVYGTTLLFGLVPTPGVSWQGHLFGAVGGVVAARLVHPRAANVRSSAA